jgi:hypothetical protein
MVEVRALLLFDRFLESGDRLVCPDFDFNDVIWMIATNPAVDEKKRLRQDWYGN